MAFTFDTSGKVGSTCWFDLDTPEQVRVVVAAARFWIGLGEDVAAAMNHLGHTVGFSDFTPAALMEVIGSDRAVPLAINADGHLDLEER